jgi:septum formation protein
MPPAVRQQAPTCGVKLTIAGGSNSYSLSRFCPTAQLSHREAYSILFAGHSMKLILASSSPRRAQILRDAGLSFTVLSSAIDESPVPGETPEQHVQRLADAKGQLVAARTVGPAIILSADTVVVLDGQILGKPRDRDEARHMLERFSGRTHSVITGVTLLRHPEMQRRQFVESTLVHFSELPQEEISRYLDTDEPYDKAGAYAIQGQAGRYIPRIEGCYFNVVGLPLARVMTALRALGWAEHRSAGA